MKRSAFKKIISHIGKIAKRATALVLVYVLVLSVFASLGINFGFPWITADAAESQTQYADINEYQLAEFSRIQNEIFTYNGGNLNTPNSTDYTTSQYLNYYIDDGKAVVKTGNDYFNWVDTDAGVDNGTISRWDGTKTTSLYYHSYYAPGYRRIGRNYYVYLPVRNAEEFYRALYSVQSYAYYRYNSSDYTSYNYYIDILTDIDMNGANYSFEPFTAYGTDSLSNTTTGQYGQMVYIEGNGHTVYNMRIAGDNAYGVGLFSYAPTFFVCKNLGFQSAMLLYTGTADQSNSSTYTHSSQMGLLMAQTGVKFSIDNVHSVGAYMQTIADGSWGLGGLIGRSNQQYHPSVPNGYGSSGNKFIKNCSTEKGVMFGGQHVGGLTSFISSTRFSADNDKQKYDVDFPDDAFDLVMRTTNFTYPFMVFDSYSVDCVLFSLGADSGSLISCGTGMRVKNCYTNNTIYAENNTGGFIGRTADVNLAGGTPPMIDDASGRQYTVNNSFENCYSSGIVEGSVAMGGFVGLTNGRRNYTQSQIAIEDGNQGSNPKGSSVFKNCFTTAMVGMDYAGKYCGGFIGMDDNYTNDTSTISVAGNTYNGKGSWFVNCYAAGEVGNILTVTDLDKAKEYEESDFFGSTLGSSTTDRSTISDGHTVFDYYPTGGFVGVSNLDRYRYHVFGYKTSSATDTGLRNWHGNYCNCYYDMQTTAMREMAVGMAECNTNTSNEPGINAGDMSNNRPFSVAGVRGVYTAKSDTKKLITISGNYVTADGSEEIPKDDYDANPAAYADKELMTMPGLTDLTDMDASGTASTDWTYAQQYYPQISSMMVADMTKSSIKEVDTSDINNNASGKNAADSVFFISDSGTSPSDGTTITTPAVSSYTKPVLSLASVQQTPVGESYVVNDETTGNQYTKQDYKPQVQTDFVNLTAAAQMSEVVKAYRYSQAATATVFLDHWDLTMNTTTGDADNQDSYEVPSLDRNAMRQADTATINGKEVPLWAITYTGLAADTYSFKINAGDSMAFSYGSRGFARNDDTCQLQIAVPNSTATIYFAFNKLNTEYYMMYAKITAPDGTETTQEFHMPPQAYQEDPVAYVLAGAFGGNAVNPATESALIDWEPADDGSGTARLRYDASRSDDNNRIYKLTLDMAEGSYQFKVAHNGWGENWGMNGELNGGNMELTLDAATTVTFLFNENTGKLTLEFSNPNSASAYNCGDHFVKREGGGVEGFSVLAHSEQIGANVSWYVNSAEGLEAAARAGLMDLNTDNTEEVEYTYPVSLSGDIWGKNYAYKIIENGVDEGANQCFYIEWNETEGASTAPSALQLTIHYYPNRLGNARYNVTVNDAELDSQVSLDQYAHFTSYGLSGVAELFGDSWLTSPDYVMSPDENDSDVLTFSFDEIRFRALGYSDGKLPEGTYSFKVLLDNSWASGLDYGDAKGKNYTFNLVQPADKLVIKFDPTSEADCKITVDVTPPTAIDTKNYVITASAAFASMLGVEEWKKDYEDAQNAIMLFNDGTQRFEKWVYGVRPNDSETLDEWGDTGYPIWCYGFKVIPVGNDDGKPNVLISLSQEKTNYDLFVQYDEGEDNVYVYAFEGTGYTHDLNDNIGLAVFKRSTGALVSKQGSFLDAGELEPTFYSVLGEEALTEYNWSGNYLPSARRGLLVPANDGSGLLHLSEPYHVTGIKSQTQFGTSYSFKVAAGGTWDLSYPASGNEIVTVAYPDSARDTSTWKKDECDIDIFFDPQTRQVVDVTAYNGANQGVDYIFDLNEDALQWYVAATNKLFDRNMFSDQENVTVYDTVRDITSDFYFTYGSGSEQRGLMVESDAVRNSTDGFYTKDDFSLTYNMKEQYLRGEDTVVRRDTMEGDFHAEVIDLKNKTLTHEVASQLSGNEKDSYDGFVLSNNEMLTKFYVEQFAPGKKWMKINTVGYGYSDEYKVWQQQFLTYNNYIDDKAKFDRYEKLYLQLCSSFPYQGGKVNEFTLYAYLTERKNDPSDEVYDSMVDALGYDLLEWKTNLENRADNGENVEPSLVFDSNTQFIVGSRDIRLIPSSYLEAGVDANVNVVQRAGDEANATNSVRLNYNTSGYASDNYEFQALVMDSVLKNDGSETEPHMVNDSERMSEIDELSFGYYNYAMTSAFLSTDKVGLGIYNNYNDQKNNGNSFAHFVADYRRDDDDSTKRNSTPESGSRADVVSHSGYRYFAMSSAYSTSGDAANNYWRQDYQGLEEYSETDVTKRTSVNLNAGFFNNMSIIGSTYDRNQTDGKEDAQVLVKIFKVNTDANGNYVMKADGSFETTPVYFSNNVDATTAYATNYKKWSGLTNFTAADTGYYEVQFNWVLSDGRYIQDSKYVDIKLVEPGITKTVSTEYETAGSNMLTYTIKYTNYNTELLVDFAILDILPFAGDVRYNSSSGRINKTNLAQDREMNFKLKAVTVQQSSKSDVREVYFTNSTAIRDWLSKTEDVDGETVVTTNEQAAANLKPYLNESGFIENSDSITWTALGHGDDSLSKYAPGRYTTISSGGTETELNHDATAVCISGMQLATGQEITVEFTFAFDGEITDYYSNDAFYYIRATEATNTEDAGMSRPVGTAIVSRNLTGFAWLDNDGDGIIDANESKLHNMQVQLYRQMQITNPDTGEVTSSYVDTGTRALTDNNGYYHFDNVEPGYYEVRFASPTVGSLNVVGSGGSQPVTFTDLRGTTKLREVNENRSGENVLDKGYTTRNLAVAKQTNPEELNEAEKRFSYAISGIYMPSNSLVYSNNNNHTMTNAIDENYLYTRLFQNAGFRSIYDNGYQYSVDIDKTNDDGDKLENVKFLFEYLNPNDGLWYPVKYKTVAEGTALETKVMDTAFTTPGTLGDYTADTWGTATVDQFEAETLPNGNYRTAYVIDKTGSDFINMHYWGDSVNTSWPGVSLRRVITNATGGNVYVAYIPEGTKGVIFNNKEGDSGLQTSNIDGDNLKTTDTIYTLTMEDSELKCSAGDTASFREVYFVNTQGWDKVYAYGWGGTYSVGDWPGYSMRQLTDTLWSTLIPTDMTGLIFSNNAGSQTVDIDGETLTQGTVFFTDGTKDGSGHYTVINDVVASGKRVFFINTPGWSSVNVYGWPDDYAGNWPGTAMTKVSDDIYYYDLPANAQGVIFNGDGAQTVDITGENSDSFLTFYKTEGFNGEKLTVNDSNVYSGNTSAEDNPNRNIYFTNNYGWTGKIYVQTIGGTNPSGNGGIEMTLDSVNDYGEQMYVANVPKDTEKLVFFNILDGQSTRFNQTGEIDYSNEVQGWYITGRTVSGEVTVTDDDYYYTDADGNISLPKLVDGRYRVTEIETLEDYVLFSEPIEFNLPYTISTDLLAHSNADYKLLLNEDYIESQDEEYIRYKHLGMNVVNHKQQFDLPLTGVNRKDLTKNLLIGLVLFLLGSIAFIFVFKKREKLQAVTLPAKNLIPHKTDKRE